MSGGACSLLLYLHPAHSSSTPTTPSPFPADIHALVYVRSCIQYRGMCLAPAIKMHACSNTHHAYTQVHTHTQTLNRLLKLSAHHRTSCALPLIEVTSLVL